MNDATLRLREDAISWTESQDETLLLDLNRSQYLGVNRAGSLLWSMLADGTTRSDLVERLQGEFALDEDQAMADVDAFVAQCERRGFLR